MSFAKLDQLGHRLESLEHAQSMLSVDEAVQMPAGGGEKRAEAMAILAGMYHELATAPHIADWIAEAETESLDAMQRAALRERKRVYTNMTCLSAEFVQMQVGAQVRSQQLWRELRPMGDWKGFLPAFEGIVTLVREEAQLRSEVLGLSPYDALIDQYDPGSRQADITPIFSALKTFLKGFIPQAMERQRAGMDKPLNAPFAIEKQKALGLAMMKAIGFDFEHGRLDISHHPFCGGVPSDVRMTTRYETGDFLSALMGILHETGHGLYEQGLPKQWSHWPVGKARGMAMHESQSLFVEKQIARSREFWQWAMPKLLEHLGEGSIAGWNIDDLMVHVHRIEPGLIRVDADEATYPLHVIMRFELEQGLVSGGLAPKDVPDAWDHKMKDYLGLSTIDNAASGPMQDVHWPSGAFGYFPSYTLGAMMAAQQWAAMERKNPGLRGDVAKGSFDAVNTWRRDNIWSKASQFSTQEILTQATGEPLQAKYFISHLKQRYLS